jgi:hypothetical protein
MTLPPRPVTSVLQKLRPVVAKIVPLNLVSGQDVIALIRMEESYTFANEKAELTDSLSVPALGP